MAELALLLAEKAYRHVEPLLPSQAAETSVPAVVAPTRLEAAHSPFFPAVQSIREDALLTPPGAVARAVPSVWVRHPVPAQLPVTSATPLAANPPVAAWQAPAALHVAVECAVTAAPPTASVLEEVLVAQPACVPLSHIALTEAVVVADC